MVAQAFLSITGKDTKDKMKKNIYHIIENDSPKTHYKTAVFKYVFYDNLLFLKG